MIPLDCVTYMHAIMRHAIIQLRINVVILATTISSAILWVLWRHTDGLYWTEWAYCYNGDNGSIPQKKCTEVQIDPVCEDRTRLQLPYDWMREIDSHIWMLWILSKWATFNDKMG